MGTRLNIPIDQSAVTDQGITGVQFQVPHRLSADGSRSVIDRGLIQVQYHVTTWDASGRRVAQAQRTVAFADWPAQFSDAVRQVYQMLEIDARNNGLFGAGTDETI